MTFDLLRALENIIHLWIMMPQEKIENMNRASNTSLTTGAASTIMAPILPLNWAVAAYAVDVSNGIENLLEFCLVNNLSDPSLPHLTRPLVLG
jgi:hypothetical protein